MSGPDFRELVGDDLSDAERERLRGVHELLVAAGPPPDLPPALERAPTPGGKRSLLPRRRRGALLALAAALAVGGFGAGYFVADRDAPRAQAFETDFVLQMEGTKAAPEAVASLVVGTKDDDGNWPMELTVRNLPQVGNSSRYELVLTRRGKVAASCGTFLVASGKTIAFLNAPYKLRQYDGWAIVRPGSHEILVRTDEI